MAAYLLAITLWNWTFQTTFLVVFDMNAALCRASVSNRPLELELKLLMIFIRFYVMLYTDVSILIKYLNVISHGIMSVGCSFFLTKLYRKFQDNNLISWQYTKVHLDCYIIISATEVKNNEQKKCQFTIVPWMFAPFQHNLYTNKLKRFHLRFPLSFNWLLLFFFCWTI